MDRTAMDWSSLHSGALFRECPGLKRPVPEHCATTAKLQMLVDSLKTCCMSCRHRFNNSVTGSSPRYTSGSWRESEAWR